MSPVVVWFGRRATGGDRCLRLPLYPKLMHARVREIAFSFAAPMERRQSKKLECL